MVNAWDPITTTSFIVFAIMALFFTHMSVHYLERAPPRYTWRKRKVPGASGGGQVERESTKDYMARYIAHYRERFGYPNASKSPWERTPSDQELWFWAKRHWVFKTWAWATCSILIIFFASMVAWAVVTDRIRTEPYVADTTTGALLIKPPLYGEFSDHEYDVRVAWHIAVQTLLAISVPIAAAMMFVCMWVIPGYLFLTIMLAGGIASDIYGLVVQQVPFTALYESLAIVSLTLDFLVWIPISIGVWLWWHKGKGSLAMNAKYKTEDVSMFDE